MTTSPNGPTDTAQLLSHYQFPAGFSGKLAQETGLNPAEVAALLQEYRRFLILAGTGRQSVTPSRLVDEAWHLHLTYSRDYWERLVPLLGRPLHHDPAGSPDEHSHYQNQYLQTLQLYRDTYGENPPTRYWPDPQRPDRSTLGRNPPGQGRPAPRQGAPNMTLAEFLRAIPGLFRRGSRLRGWANGAFLLGLMGVFFWCQYSGLSTGKVLLGVACFGGVLATNTPGQNRSGNLDIDSDLGDSGDAGGGDSGGDGGGCGSSCGGGCGGGGCGS